MEDALTAASGPVAVPQRTGTLLASAAGLPAGMDWNRYSFAGEQCPQVDVFGFCEVPPVQTDTGTSLVSVRPVSYSVSTECSTVGTAGVSQDVVDRLTRQAESVASYAVASELWRGTAAKRNRFTEFGVADQVNPSLSTGAEQIGTGAVPGTAVALGRLEQAAAQATRGQQVVLHVPISLVTAIADKLIVSGSVLRTATGAIVVADAGYDGSGPDGTVPTDGTAWAYATGSVVAGVGATTLTTDPASILDRTTNRYRPYATRPFVAAFDPCAHFSILINPNTKQEN